MAELLPCPFCGSAAEIERDSDHHGEFFNLGCSQHWGRVDTDDACKLGRLWYTESAENEADAIAAWNRRSPSPSRMSGAVEVLEGKRAFQKDERVTKVSGSSWTGRVVGFYETGLTPIGYCVESENEPGSVQIYPQSALKSAE